MSNFSGPLSGVRVIDMTNSYAGPVASMYLADLGAEVIKVERPGHGDDARTWGPPFVAGTSAWFASANRNKRSVVLNLQESGGRHVLHELLAGADVFLQNMNPVKLERMGIDGPSLLRKNPRLVYCAMSGFGLDGPDSALPGYDLTAQARSGLMSVTGALGGSPQRVSTALSDIATGMNAALAINAALVRQQREGVGEIIDVSLLDSDLALMAPRIASFWAGETEPAPSGGTDSVLAVYQPFATRDRTIAVAIGNDLMWQRFCVAVGLEHLEFDPVLVDNAGRRGQREQITALIAAKLTERTAAEWLVLFAERDIPASLVKSLSEVVDDPQVMARGSLLPVPGSDDELVSVRAPFRLHSQSEPRNERFPALGADTRDVLIELGYTEREISGLVNEGVISVSDETKEAELA